MDSCLCVCLFVTLLFLQFWADYIQTCYMGSAWPQLVHRGVFIFAGGQGGTQIIIDVNVYLVAPRPGGGGLVCFCFMQVTSWVCGLCVCVCVCVSVQAVKIFFTIWAFVIKFSTKLHYENMEKTNSEYIQWCKYIQWSPLNWSYRNHLYIMPKGR